MRADRDHRDAELRPTSLRIRSANGVWYDAPERRPLLLDHLPGGDVDGVGAVLGERPGDRDRVVDVDAAVVPVGGRDPHAHRPLAPATPPAPRRRPPAGSAAGSPATRRTRRCAGWTAATGTRRAGSRARSAARAGRTRRGAPRRRAGDELVPDLVQVGAGRARAAPGWPASTAARTGRRPPSCPRPAARRCPPTSAWSSPCGRSGRAAGRSRRRTRACTKSTIRAQAGLLLVGVEAGAAGGDPARSARRTPSRSSPARRRRAPCRRGGRGGSRSARRRRPSTCPSARRRPGCAAPARRSRNGLEHRRRDLAGARPPRGEPARPPRRRTPGRAAAGCRR